MSLINSDSENFCWVSLGDWVRFAQTVDIPFIAITPVANYERNDLLCQDIHGPHQHRLSIATDKLVRTMKRHYMMRWDCCASDELKWSLSEGHCDWQDSFMGLNYVGDERLLEILYDYPRFVVPVWQRPWVQASMVDEYPVEYRVFVDSGKIVGISNYYPQRPIVYTEGHIRSIAVYTKKLIDALTPPFQLTRGMTQKDANMRMSRFMMKDGEKYIPQDKRISFSADFLVTENNEVMFLEGGPPHFSDYGAHPCCFKGSVEGVALSRGTVIPLPEFVKELA